MKPKIKSGLAILVGFAALVFLYTLLHEGGHAIVVLLHGGEIDEFILGLNAHVSYHGAEFSSFGLLLLHASGALLPVLVSAVAMLFYKPSAKSGIYNILFAISSIGFVSSLLPWVVIPIASMFTPPPAGDDITKFLSSSGFSPIAVALGALLLIGALILLIYKKGLFGVVKALVRKGANSRMRLIICAVLLAIVCAVFAFQSFGGRPIINISASEEITESTFNEYKFNVDKAKKLTMSIDLPADGFLADICVFDADGGMVYQNISNRFKLKTLLRLNEGEYRLVVFFLTDPAALERHVEDVGLKFDADVLRGLKEVFDENTTRQVKYTLTIK